MNNNSTECENKRRAKLSKQRNPKPGLNSQNQSQGHPSHLQIENGGNNDRQGQGDEEEDQICQVLAVQMRRQNIRAVEAEDTDELNNNQPLIQNKVSFAAGSSVKFNIVCERERLYAAMVHMLSPGPFATLSYTSMKLLEALNPLHLFMRKIGPSDFSACIGTPCPKSLEALRIRAIQIGLTYRTPMGFKRIKLEVPVNNLGLPLDMRWKGIPRAEESILALMNGSSFEAIVSIHFVQEIEEIVSSQILAKYVPSSYCHHDVFVYSSDNHVFLSSSSALAAHSPYLRKHLFENSSALSPYRVRFPTVNRTETEAILRFIHHRDITTATSSGDVHFVINLFYLTASLEIPLLRMELEKYLMSEVHVESDIEILIKLLRLPRHGHFHIIRERVITLFQEKPLRELRDCAMLQEAMRKDVELTNEILEGFPPHGNNDSFSDITSPELEPVMALSPSPLLGFMSPV